MLDESLRVDEVEDVSRKFSCVLGINYKFESLCHVLKIGVESRSFADVIMFRILKN